MLELQLKKRSTVGGGSSGTTVGTTAALGMITTAATTASNGGIPATTLDGYFTDSSTSGLGGHQPLITISHPNGKKG